MERNTPVCIYVDNSNLFIGGQEAARARGEDPIRLRIDFDHFLKLVTQGTMHFDELVWAGSGEGAVESIFSGLKEKGIDVQIIPRGKGGEHETVDQAIQLAMYRHCRKYRDTPGLMVLCTGDGKGFQEEKGFLWDVTGFIEDGWQLMLYSWNAICHEKLREFAQQHGGYVPLEDHYNAITFLEDGRIAGEVQL